MMGGLFSIICTDFLCQTHLYCWVMKVNHMFWLCDHRRRTLLYRLIFLFFNRKRHFFFWVRNVVLTAEIVLDWKQRARTLLCWQRNIIFTPLHLSFLLRFSFVIFIFFLLFLLFFLFSLFEILPDQFFCLLLHHLHSHRPVLLGIDAIGFFYHRIVLCHLRLILQRKYLCESSKMFIFVLISRPLSLLHCDFPLLPLINLPLPSHQPLLIDIFDPTKQLIFVLDVDVEDI